MSFIVFTYYSHALCLVLTIDKKENRKMFIEHTAIKLFLNQPTTHLFKKSLKIPTDTGQFKLFYPANCNVTVAVTQSGINDQRTGHLLLLYKFQTSAYPTLC